MTLRWRCFAQTSLRIFCLNPQCPAYRPPQRHHHRFLHFSRIRHQKDDDEEDIFAEEENGKPDPEQERELQELYSRGKQTDNRGKEGEEEKKSRQPRKKNHNEREESPKALTSLTQLDAGMDDEDLGLKTMRRRAKVAFRRWLMQEAPVLREYPQYLLQGIEEERIEKLRKGSEDRMFSRMNDFYDSLTLEEILAGKLAMKTDKKGRILPNQKRERHPHPAPFQQVMTGKILLDISAKEFESRVLALLARYDHGLSLLYKNYIDWSDYQLQKRQLWFLFPPKVHYRDVVEHLWKLQPGLEGKLAAEEDAEELSEGLHSNEEPWQDEYDEHGNAVPIESSPTLESADMTTESASTEQLYETGTTSKPSKPETPTSDESTIIAERNALKTEMPVPAYKVEPMDPPALDLGTYFGPEVGMTVGFPVLPIAASNYANRSLRYPFPSNRLFKPWRPLSHSTRLRMFDAWREGLGLRNIAWMGGVSWRRADGIIGIMKREWQFVAEVMSPCSSLFPASLLL
jgi:hypothetical protein